MFRIYLTNLGKYNEGQLVGKWVDLPVDDDFESAFEEIGIGENYEEWFITDYENDFDYQVGEYDDIFKLNELAQDIEDYIDDSNMPALLALLQYGNNLEDAINNVDDCIIYDNISDEVDLAHYIVDERVYLENVSETIAMYFDYAAFGRDLTIKNNYEFVEYNGTDYCVLIG